MNQRKAPKEKVTSTSGDVLEAQLEKLKSLFPEVVAEGKVDFDKLKAILGGAVDNNPGRFHFSWAGKDDAISLLQTPSRGTLIPCPEESVNWDTTANAFIEGDNLEVLKLLFKPYFGKVKLIYIDPPYNTGQDFVYPDNYADPLRTYLQLTGQADEEGNLQTSNPETGGRYHSSWLSMMYPRLFLARQLLQDDGVICISIDDNEVHHLRLVMNEIFGEENFVATVIWHKMDSPKNSAKFFSEDHDYIMIFARDTTAWVPNALPRSQEMLDRYKNPDDDQRGPWLLSDLAARNFYSAGRFAITTPSGRVIEGPPAGSYWRISESKFQELDKDGRIWWGKNNDNRPGIKRFLSEVRDGVVPQTYWSWEEVGSNRNSKQELSELLSAKSGEELFITPKPASLIRRILQITTEASTSDYVVDFFSGSGTTAQAVLELNVEEDGNRKFILVQLPEPIKNGKYKTIADVGKERIRRVISELKKDLNGRLDLKDDTPPQDLGFKVFKLASPNIEQWIPENDRDPDRYAAKLELFNDPLVADWKPENVLWEVALREGFGLNSKFAEKKLANGNLVYEVTDPDKDPPQSIAVCLDEAVHPDLSKHYPLTTEHLFICRDIALDDTGAANLALQCRLKTI